MMDHCKQEILFLSVGYICFRQRPREVSVMSHSLDHDEATSDNVHQPLSWILQLVGTPGSCSKSHNIIDEQ